MYYFMLDEESSVRHNFVVTKRPDIPSVKYNYNEYDIPGRDGKLYENLGTVDDIVIDIECNYISNPNLWHSRWREIKKWLLKKHDFLSLSDDNEYCYRIKKIELGTNEREVIVSGSFTITFTLEGYMYLKSGQIEYLYSTVLFNAFEKTMPKYIITGEGNCTLTVNGTECTCNVGQNLIIDTYLRLSYRKDGTLQNTSINADYEDLMLLEGDNDISITNDFDLKIVPNWRCL